MPEQPKITRAVVVNLTKRTLHPRTHEGDSVSIPPNTNGRSVTINYKFLQCIAPHPNDLRVLYYMDDSGNRYEKLPESDPPPAEAEPAEADAAEGEHAEHADQPQQ